MRAPRALLLGGLALALLAPLAAARAQPAPRVLRVSPAGPFTTLEEALAAARDGDAVHVLGGIYPRGERGALVIDERIALVGHGWPVIAGEGVGTVVRITAAGASLRGFVVRGSGASLDQESSGIAIEAPEVVVEGNRLEDTLFGVYVRRAPGVVVRRNWIESKPLDLPRRGDAIRVWYSDGVRLEENVVRDARDVVLWYSSGLVVRGNVVSGGRYGLHFMYCDDAEIAGNRLTGNSVGVFLMYSRRLRLTRNLMRGNRGPSGYGVGLKDMDDALVADNVFVDNRVGAYVDNSPREVDATLLFERNVFAANDAGVRLLPLVRRNTYRGNAFLDNREQVSLTGGGRLEGNVWLGNYWSDYAGYDADRDGRGDVPYRAERLFESLVDRDPALRLFSYSPAAEAVDLAARAFPLVRPQPKLTDPAPLMAVVLPLGVSAGGERGPGALLAASAALGLLAAFLVAQPLLPHRRDRRATAAAAPEEEATAAVAAAAGRALVEVRGLVKAFGAARAVDGLGFAVSPGEAVALWGANGAGKTTAIRCLLGLLPYAGEVRIDGIDVAADGKGARRRIGFVPQELGFHDDLSVRETLRFYARLKQTSLAPIPALLARLGLAEHAHKAVRELSGGLKQRLALAVALLADPPLLVLDEPTANLDARARAALLGLLGELKARGKALVFSSHRLEEVTALCDRVLVLERGRLEADVPAGRLGEHLGLRSVLHLVVGEAERERAAAVLSEAGFAPELEGAGLTVRVDPRGKARPLALLDAAGVEVHGFELGRAEPERSAP